MSSDARLGAYFRLRTIIGLNCLLLPFSSTRRRSAIENIYIMFVHRIMHSLNIIKQYIFEPQISMIEIRGIGDRINHK